MKFNKLSMALFASSLVLVTSAQAALPASVGSTITTMQADMQAVFDATFPLVALGVGLVTVVKLFKRFTGKV